MAAQSFSSSSSSFTYGFTYDVFLSFRGPDTRNGFTGSLFKALDDKGIHTFLDDEELRGGEEITPSLRKAIGKSRIAILVLSKNYASSSFCLDELSYILDCIKQKGRLVLPVFYDVDPSHVRHQIGTYREALAKHEGRFKDNMEKVQNWRQALHQVANLSGYHFKHGDGYEYQFIGRIVKEVSSKINRAPLHVADYPVGMENRVLEVKSLLDIGSDDGVHMVGIYGVGGIGKTTIARAIYNLIADQFEGLCFLDDVREYSVKNGLVHLQETLLSKIIGEKDIELGSVNEGISIIKHRLHRKKVLLIIDDVDELEQLRAIVGGPDWFGPCSRVIITTRDKHLLAYHGVERIYEVEDLNATEAIELLSWNAFKNVKVDPSYMGILNRAVAYASGLPLALEVIGSHLFGKSIKEWESALDQYERIPNKKIQNILKVSFNALEEDEQKIFLDIACCLKGYELAEVEDIFSAHYGVCMKYGIKVLVEKSLLKIKENGCVTLHDLIEDMGKEIVRQESLNEPGERSRLWFPEDIVQILEDNTGTNKIQIIMLRFPIFEEKEVEWDGEGFKEMKNLKTLIIRNCRFSRGPKHLPNSLRVLEWTEYPSPSLPYDFHPKKLAILKLRKSCVVSLKLAELLKKFVNMRVLDFSDSNKITKIPDVSGIPNLEKLSISYCRNLLKIHESVGFLDKLKILDASGCSKLRTFPPIKLTSLEELNISGCLSLQSFPEILGKMENLTHFIMNFTPIRELPFSIRNLTGLRSFLMDRCPAIVKLPRSIFMLPELDALNVWKGGVSLLPELDEGEEQVSSNPTRLAFRYCDISDEFLQIGLSWFANVKELDLSWSDFTIVPACIKECCFLRKIDLNYCNNLREIRGSPPNIEELSATNCPSLTSLSRSMLLNEELHEEGGNKKFCLPGTRIPEWFEHRIRGQSISFWFRNKFPAVSLCYVIRGASSESYTRRSRKLIINGSKVFQLDKQISHYSFGEDHILIFDEKQINFEDNADEVLLENEWNHVEFSIDIHGSLPKGMSTIQIGLHVFEQESCMEDIRFTNPPWLKEKRRLVGMGDSQRQFMQQQTNLASLPLLETPVVQGRECWDSNSTLPTRLCSTTSVQGLEIASRKKKRGTLRLDNEANEPSCPAPSEELSDSQSDSMSSSRISDTASDGGGQSGGCEERDMSTLDSEARELFSCLEDISDSQSINSRWTTDIDDGSQEQQHLTSINQQDFEAHESVNEAMGKEKITLDSRNEEENGRSPLIELLQTTKVRV